MNYSIDQLKAKALDIAVPETWSKLSNEQLQKVLDVFAKLIVQECSALNHQFTGRRASATDLEVLYKKHFGIAGASDEI